MNECPTCGQPTSAGAVCCAGREKTWKCRSCHKLSRSFATAFGKCSLCGGDLRDLHREPFDDPLTVMPIREAIRLELDSYHFYRLAWLQARDPVPRAFFEEMAQLEIDHLHELAARYHVQIDRELLVGTPQVDRALSSALFAGIPVVEPSKGAVGLFNRALAMENRAMLHFRSMAESLPEGAEKDICLELAAEEKEHIRLLQNERSRYVG
jgi:hypothetical protein